MSAPTGHRHALDRLHQPGLTVSRDGHKTCRRVLANQSARDGGFDEDANYLSEMDRRRSGRRRLRRDSLDGRKYIKKGRRIPGQATGEHAPRFIKARPAGNRLAEFTEIAHVDQRQLCRIPGRVLDPSVVGREQEKRGNRQPADASRPKPPQRRELGAHGESNMAGGAHGAMLAELE